MADVRNEQTGNILLETGTNELEILVFLIAGQPYGINVAKVREIITLPRILKMPQMPPAVDGVFELRGKIIPLINMRNVFGVAGDAPPEIERVIVSEFNAQEYAFRVDAIRVIHRVSWQNVQPPDNVAALAKPGASPPVTGIVRQNEQVIQMLDFEKIVYDLAPNMTLAAQADSGAVAELPIPMAGTLKIMVAEDSRVARKVLRRILEKAGVTAIETFGNGQDAWDRIGYYSDQATATGRPITDYVDLLITDIEMPQMDGHHLCNRIKQSAVLRDLPVVIYSSLITPELETKGASVGADYQVAKNEPEQIITVLAREFGRG